jgi:cell division protein FtsQ
VNVLANDPQGEVLVHLGSSNYLERYKIYVTHVQQWRQQFDKLESVDLRYDRQVIVNPDLGGAMKQPALSLSAVKSAMAAGVKSAALVRHERLPAKPPAAITAAKASEKAPAKPPARVKPAKSVYRKPAPKNKRASAPPASKSIAKQAPPKPHAAAQKANPPAATHTIAVASKKKPSAAIAKSQEQP